MMEGRRLKRNNLIYYLPVTNRDTGQQLGNLVDITAEGLMLVSEAPLETDRVFRLSMALPEEIRGQTQISFDTRSIWCKKDVNPDFSDTGFRFVEISNQTIAIINDLIEDYFIDND